MMPAKCSSPRNSTQLSFIEIQSVFFHEAHTSHTFNLAINTQKRFIIEQKVSKLPLRTFKM